MGWGEFSALWDVIKKRMDAQEKPFSKSEYEKLKEAWGYG